MDDFWLWRFVFGNIHFVGLKLLQQKDMVKGLPPIKELASTCECCILAKKHKDSFPKGMSRRAHAPLELVHTNLCSPMQNQSLGGNYIDDFNKKTWMYFLHQKLKTSRNLRPWLKNRLAINSKY